MTYGQILFAVGLVVIALCTFLVIRIILDMRQRTVVTVARPTTNDGESVQITSNIRASADATEIADYIEKASLAIQGRMVNQNELVLETMQKENHAIWLRIRKKLDDAAAEGRHGMGVLSPDERKWWFKNAKKYDEKGLIVQGAKSA